MALVAAAILPSIAEKRRGHEGECQRLEQFLAVLKTAWKDGTALPTEQPTPLSAVGGDRARIRLRTRRQKFRRRMEAEPNLTAR
jgi:hypothetical protein